MEETKIIKYPISTWISHEGILAIYERDENLERGILEFGSPLKNIYSKYTNIIINARDGIYVRGMNHCGKLAMNSSGKEGNDEDLIMNFTKIDFKRTVIDVATGSFHTAFLCEDGVYTCGENRHGQLGNPQSYPHGSHIPTRINMDDRIEQVICQRQSTIMRTGDGIYFCGDNCGNVLFLTENRDILSPIKLLSGSYDCVYTNEQLAVSRIFNKDWTEVYIFSNNIIRRNKRCWTIRNYKPKPIVVRGQIKKIHIISYHLTLILTSTGLYSYDIGSGKNLVPVDKVTINNRTYRIVADSTITPSGRYIRKVWVYEYCLKEIFCNSQIVDTCFVSERLYVVIDNCGQSEIYYNDLQYQNNRHIFTGFHKFNNGNEAPYKIFSMMSWIDYLIFHTDSGLYWIKHGQDIVFNKIRGTDNIVMLEDQRYMKTKVSCSA